jgi:hypothetical protein
VREAPASVESWIPRLESVLDHIGHLSNLQDLAYLLLPAYAEPKVLESPINDSIVQRNTVGHPGASSFERLAKQALFAGEVTPQQRYLIVDDFVGQGGTLANLIGFIASRGGQVVAATDLTGC